MYNGKFCWVTKFCMISDGYGHAKVWLGWIRSLDTKSFTHPSHNSWPAMHTNWVCTIIWKRHIGVKLHLAHQYAKSSFIQCSQIESCVIYLYFFTVYWVNLHLKYLFIQSIFEDTEKQNLPTLCVLIRLHSHWSLLYFRTMGGVSPTHQRASVALLWPHRMVDGGTKIVQLFCMQSAR